MKHQTSIIAGPAMMMAITLLFSCKKNDNTPATTPDIAINRVASYTIPTTYDFSNVDSIPAKTYLSMLAQMENTINTGNTRETVVSGDMLKGMFGNTGNYFKDTTLGKVVINLNAAVPQLKSGTVAAAQALINTMFDSIAANSRSVRPSSNGVAGVSTRNTLLSANGIFWRQYFTKTMMGVLIAHQITDVYLGDSLNSNISLAAKQHAWDQAFYLWCVPVGFPANRTGVKYWGSYSSQIDSGIVKPVVNLTGINANTTLMNAFLKGRAALANSDVAMALQQAAIIIPFFETMEAAAALHELNEARGNLANTDALCGNLSESMGFWMALKFNSHKKISDADYQAVLNLYGSNFYLISPAGIDALKDKISSIYGWNSIKSNL